LLGFDDDQPLSLEKQTKSALKRISETTASASIKGKNIYSSKNLQGGLISGGGNKYFQN
jgi:hypothetical protein